MLKGAIPFFGISKNEDGRELTVQYAELKNCLINRKNHAKIRPGTNNLTIPSLSADEEVVKNYRWKGVRKNIFLTNLGRVFEYYQVSGYTYGIIELVNLEDYVGNDLYENNPRPPVGAGYTWVKGVKTVANGIIVGIVSNAGPMNQEQVVYNAEADGIVTSTCAHIGLIAGITLQDICKSYIDYVGTDNVVISYNASGSYFFEVYQSLAAPVQWRSRAEGTNFIDQMEKVFTHPASNDYVIYIGTKTGFTPRLGYARISLDSFNDLGPATGMSTNETIYDAAAAQRPGGTQLKIFAGIENKLLYYRFNGPTAFSSGLVATFSGNPTMVHFDDVNDYLFVATDNGLLYWADLSTSAKWTSPSLSILYNYGSQIFGLNHKIVEGVHYVYFSDANGTYLLKNMKIDNLQYNPESTEANYKKKIKDIFPVTHSDGREGILFFNTQYAEGKVFVVYPSSADTIEGYTYLTEYNVEVFETDKGRIDPSDGTETEAEFLIIRFVGRLVYYKNGGGSGKIRYYYDPTVPGYTTDEIPLIASATYSDGLIVIGYQDKNRITCSRPLEFLHFDQTVYFSANYSPTPNKKLEAANGLIFVFSDTDTEIWTYTPGVEHDALLGRVSVIQNGLIAKEAVAKIPGAICWLNEMRELVVSTGGEPTPMADDLIKEFHGLDNFDEALMEYVRVANLQFLTIVIPGEDVSYVYDINNNFYYEWDAFKIASFAFDIQGANAFGVIYNNLALISQDFTDDSGSDIDLRIRTGFIDREIPEHKICHQLWITYVKETTDTALIRVRYKDKNGGDWSNYRDIPANGQGQFTSVLYALGRYQRRQWEISYTGDAGIVILEIEEHFEVLEW